RIATGEELRRPFGTPSDHVSQLKNLPPGELNFGSEKGRWPANVLLDHHAAAWVDEQSGISVSKASESRGLRGGILRLDGCRTVDELRALAEAGEKTPTGRDARTTLARYEASEDGPRGHTDSGGASRFFYTAKA